MAVFSSLALAEKDLASDVDRDSKGVGPIDRSVSPIQWLEDVKADFRVLPKRHRERNVTPIERQ